MSRAVTTLGRDTVLALGTLGAALASFGCAVAIQSAADLSAPLPVLAVALCVTLRGVRHESAREHLLAALQLPVVALATGGVGWLIVSRPWIGQPLLVVGLCAGILARRYPPAIRQAGRLVSLPFVALFVAPVVGPTHEARAVWWTPLVAVLAWGWTSLAQALLARRGYTDPPPAPSPVPRGRARRRWDAPSRMALQMAVGLAVALAAGHLLFGDEWGFTVLSAYVVAAGNRGRGDVAHKAGLRVLGGVAGTALATLGGGLLPTGNRWLLVALFAVLFVGLLLRRRSYAWWAGSVTAMLALLHAYYGQHGTAVLGDRLLGVLLGCTIGLAAAWFVAPVRTRDVYRRYVANCLAGLTDDLADAGAGRDAPALHAALRQLDTLRPTLRAHRRAANRSTGTHPVDALDALHAITPLPLDSDDRRRLRRATVRVHRAMAGRDDPGPDELPAALATVHRSLQQTWTRT